MLTDDKLSKILNEGMPEKQSLFQIIQNIGLKSVFFGMSTLILTISLCFIIILGLFIIICKPEDIRNLYIDVTGLNTLLITISMLSPILFTFFSLVSAFEDRNTPLFELKMTCMYNSYILTGIRMLVLSSITILYNMVAIVIFTLPLGNEIFISSICLSLSSLFLYSILLLVLIRRTNRFRMYLLPSFIWIVLNIFMYVLNYSYNIRILSSIPAVFYAVATIILVCMFGLIVRKFMTTIKGEFNYASYIQHY